MRIGAYIKQSFVDWENKICSVVFTKGCNFRCPYCHNPELVEPKLYETKKDISRESIFEHLATRQHWLDGVVISGGEPTLQEGLDEFIRYIKNMGYSIKLDTNGSKPDILKKLIGGRLIDFISMDIKTVVEKAQYKTAIQRDIPALTNSISESIGIIRNS